MTFLGEGPKVKIDVLCKRDPSTCVCRGVAGTFAETFAGAIAGAVAGTIAGYCRAKRGGLQGYCWDYFSDPGLTRETTCPPEEKIQ